jgi:nicotinic acid mononucleotide adenylyltransferase
MEEITEQFEIGLQKLRDKNQKGILIETGAGSPLYAELCDRPNTASKLVYFALSPTSWDYTKYKCKIHKDQRAISKETCHDMIRSQMYENYEHTNYIFVNSIQIGNDEQTQTHGWIGISLKENYHTWNTYYYHFTIDNYYQAKNRKELILQIREICLDVFVNPTQPTNGYIDMAFEEIISNDISPINSRSSIKILLNQKIQNTLAEHYCDDTYICFKKGKLIRFNDVLREAPKNFILYKGAFNPIHPEHINLINKTQESIPNSEIWLMISIENRDPKKVIEVDNLMKRIGMITEMGYNVIVNTKGLYFYSNLQIVNHLDFKDKKLYQLMGDDTLTRLIEDDGNNTPHEFENITILVRKRKFQKELTMEGVDIQYLDHDLVDISSTNIRDLIKNGQHDIIKKEHGEVYFEILKIHFIEQKE